MLKDLGRRLAEIRRDSDATQQDVADALGTNVSNYAQMEQGRRNLTVGTLSDVAAILGVDVVEFFSAPSSNPTAKGRPRRRQV